ncbi:MAG: YARHG domain-containing protein [Bacteroidales bacterium]|nr:YARHG domain-containing protein [Bacteroidales bacterium]
MKVLTSALLWLLAIAASANDGVFYVNGSQIVPINETDVAVTKEVLTITLDNSDYARVDVLYEFTNTGADKVVDMGFEASAPYTPGESNSYKKDFKHPYIYDFTVTMNGSKLDYKNYLMEQTVVDEEETHTNFKPIDLKVWETPSEDEDVSMLYNSETDKYMSYSYAYVFKGNFKKGKNVVHHTYRYKMSNGVFRCFEVPYWLLPAMRWANRQIDDFTLRIVADGTAKQFCLSPDNWTEGEWRVTSGVGKMHTLENSWCSFLEFSLRNGTYEWHGTNFKPKNNFWIISADNYLFGGEEAPLLGRFYDRRAGCNYVYATEYDDDGNPINMNTDGLDAKRIMRNLPYAHRGYVFKDKKLADYFKSLWWYMPDPNWKQSTADFLPGEFLK